MASIVTLTLALTTCALARSQPPTPGDGERDGSQPNEQANAAETKPNVLIGTESSPAFVRVTKTPQETDQEQRDRNRQASAQRWTIATGVIMAVLTMALIAVGVAQWLTYKDHLAAMKVIERASISLTTLRLDRPTFDNMNWTVTMGLTNHGHTSARLEQCLVILRESDSLPPIPQYNRAPSATAPPLLSAGESTNWRELIGITEVEGGTTTTNTQDRAYWIYGRIRFRDAFNQPHEYGFGREWRPDDPALEHKVRQERFGYPQWSSYNYARPEDEREN